MEHTTHTRIIFADSLAEAKDKYLALNIQPDHDQNPKIDVIKASEEEDFEADAPFGLFGEVSVGIEVMDEIRKDVDRAYVVYYIEKLEK